MWSYQHSNFTVHQFAALKDNYIYLIDAHNSGALIAVDPAEAVSISRFCKAHDRTLTHIINTHHHWDHTDGNKALKQKFGCKVIGPANDAHRIPAIDIAVSEKSPPRIAGLEITVLQLPGHTSGHIAYVIDDALFCGDVLFGAGCGRVFEGTRTEMWNSLTRLAELAGETRIYCAHEYTLANLEFAQTVDPSNGLLVERTVRTKQLRADHQPTIPSTIADEISTNPFLRPLNAEFCRYYASLRGVDANPEKVFTDIRDRKDRF
ncbi:hydroxyacylglutathione hydrolase [Mariprofundus ferrinatatus]|uniref:Hydroxyacylglutathione hydrolase n=1 Tax=Mariprofundus ferrinatatus TaxID=1921087 RepID=A0A2K8L5F8_9PROT|nr:hydroxyacylglutathione hydrolase [Mariprofundus ferrinatatus]ATX82517.1 hydroxyacylglutathione hydrolase [Mariprofundus ferrinatatus]